MQSRIWRPCRQRNNSATAACCARVARWTDRGCKTSRVRIGCGASGYHEARRPDSSGAPHTPPSPSRLGKSFLRHIGTPPGSCIAGDTGRTSGLRAADRRALRRLHQPGRRIDRRRDRRCASPHRAGAGYRPLFADFRLAAHRPHRDHPFLGHAGHGTHAAAGHCSPPCWLRAPCCWPHCSGRRPPPRCARR